MTTKVQELELKRSELAQKKSEMLAQAEEARGESWVDDLAQLNNRSRALEVEYQAVAALEPEPQVKEVSMDAEMRERVELRSKARLGRYLVDRIQGKQHSGAEAELQAATGIFSGIPMEMWEKEREELRAVTPAPSTVGVNLQPIAPALFAPSVLPSLGVEMPQVPSGTYSHGTITTSASAGAVAKSAAIAATEGAITVGSSTPKRIAARLELTLEDIATIGVDNFEPILRENLSLALSSELDDQGLNGVKTNADNNVNGLFQKLTDPAAPAAGVAGFDDFVAAYADGIDGLWASMASEIGILCGVETYQLSVKLFRDIASAENGDTSFATYAREHFGGWRTNSRMPAKDSHVQQAILYRMGRTGLRRAVMPSWGVVEIDDIYSGSAKGERYVTLSALVGDVIVVQPGAYKQVSFRVSS